MIGDSGARVAAAEQMNLAVEHDGRVTATWGGQRCTVTPGVRASIVDEHAIAWHVRRRVESTKQIDALTNGGSRRRVESVAVPVITTTGVFKRSRKSPSSDQSRI